MVWGFPLQVLKPLESGEHRNSTGNWTLTAESKRWFEALEGPISLVSVAGPYHTGKSFFLNELIRRFKLADNHDVDYFAVGYTVSAETHGIWLWNEVLEVCIDRGETKNYRWIDPTELVDAALPCETDPVKIAWMDTEGYHSPGVDEVSDAKMFALTFLLSSNMIYNTIRVIDQQALEYMELLTRRSALFGLRAFARNHSSDGDESSTQDSLLSTLLRPPDFSWVLQDFVQDLENKTPLEYFQDLLSSEPTTRFVGGDGNKTPLGTLFQSIDCFVVPPPIGRAMEQQKLDLIDRTKLYPEYKEAVDFVSNSIVMKAASNPKRLQNNTYYDGRDLAYLLEYLVLAANTDSNSSDGLFPAVPSLWSHYRNLQSSLLGSDLLRDYKKVIDDYINQAYNQIPSRTVSTRDAVLYMRGPPILLLSYLSLNEAYLTDWVRTNTTPVLPLPNTWLYRWSSIGTARLFTLVKRHIQASGTELNTVLAEVIGGTEHDGQLVKIILQNSSDFYSLPLPALPSHDMYHYYGELLNLDFFKSAIMDLGKINSTFAATFQQRVYNWCNWTSKAQSKSLVLYRDVINEDQTIIFSHDDVLALMNEAEGIYLEFWTDMTNKPFARGAYDRAGLLNDVMEEDDDSYMTREESIFLTKLPPYEAPIVSESTFKYRFTDLDPCRDSQKALVVDVQRFANTLNLSMHYRRGKKIWEYLNTALEPLFKSFMLKPAQEPRYYEEFSFICTYQSVSIPRIGVLPEWLDDLKLQYDSPPRSHPSFVPVDSSSALQLLQNYETLEGMLTESDTKSERLVSKLAEFAKNKMFQGDERVNYAVNWVFNEVLPQYRLAAAKSWDQACAAEANKAVQHVMNRLIAKIKANLTLPVLEHELIQAIEAEKEPAYGILKEQLHKCMAHSGSVIQAKFQQSFAENVEALERSNVVAIRALAGDSLKHLFLSIQAESAGWYIWRNFLEDAFIRAEKIIRDSAARNGKVYPDELIAKVARISVEEITLPLGIEGKYYSHDVKSLAEDHYDALSMPQPNACNDLNGQGWTTYLVCMFDPTFHSNHIISKGSAYEYIEQNHFDILGRYMYILAALHAWISIYKPEGSPLWRWLMIDSFWTRLLGGRGYGTIEYNTINDIFYYQPNRRSWSIMNGSKLRIIGIILNILYMNYCGWRILGLPIVGKTDMTIMRIITFLTLFAICCVIDSCISLLLSTCRYILTYILLAIQSLPKPICWLAPSSLNGSKWIPDTFPRAMWNRVWYSNRVYICVLAIWIGLLVLLPHVLMDNWRSMYRRVTAENVVLSDKHDYDQYERTRYTPSPRLRRRPSYGGEYEPNDYVTQRFNQSQNQLLAEARSKCK